MTPDTECLMCGQGPVVQRRVDTTFPYGAGADQVEIPISLTVSTCQNCGRQFTDEAAEKERHDVLCRHFGLLTPDEIRQIRRQTGLSRKEFASETGLGEASIARWESGAVLQSVSHDRYLRLIQRDPMAIKRVQQETRASVATSAPLTRRFPFIQKDRFAVLRERARNFQLALPCT